MSIASEFREFALKGNVIDLAVGVIIGAAFGKIVDSLVKDVIMPVVNVITGGSVDFSQKYLVLSGSIQAGTPLEAAQKAGAPPFKARELAVAAKNALISSLTQLDATAFGEQMTMRKRERRSVS